MSDKEKNEPKASKEGFVRWVFILPRWIANIENIMQEEKSVELWF
jgi:hypothetical protein